MKKLLHWVMIAFTVVIACCAVGIVSYRERTQIDLGSGLIRQERSLLGIVFIRTPPKPSTLSRALGRDSNSPRWLTIGYDGILFMRNRIDFCYPKMLFWIGAIDRSFSDKRVTATIAKLTLDNLNELEDTCILRRKLDMTWGSLLDDYDQSWSDAEVESEISRIWQNAETEQAGTGQPATRSQSKSEGGDKPQPEAEGRPR